MPPVLIAVPRCASFEDLLQHVTAIDTADRVRFHTPLLATQKRNSSSPKEPRLPAMAQFPSNPLFWKHLRLVASMSSSAALRQPPLFHLHDSVTQEGLTVSERVLRKAVSTFAGAAVKGTDASHWHPNGRAGSEGGSSSSASSASPNRPIRDEIPTSQPRQDAQHHPNLGLAQQLHEDPATSASAAARAIGFGNGVVLSIVAVPSPVTASIPRLQTFRTFQVSAQFWEHVVSMHHAMLLDGTAGGAGAGAASVAGGNVSRKKSFAMNKSTLSSSSALLNRSPLPPAAADDKVEDDETEQLPTYLQTVVLTITTNLVEDGEVPTALQLLAREWRQIVQVWNDVVVGRTAGSNQQEGEGHDEVEGGGVGGDEHRPSDTTRKEQDEVGGITTRPRRGAAFDSSTSAAQMGVEQANEGPMEAHGSLRLQQPEDAVRCDVQQRMRDMEGGMFAYHAALEGTALDLTPAEKDYFWIVFMDHWRLLEAQYRNHL